jgi:hypothetical protein
VARHWRAVSFSRKKIRQPAAEEQNVTQAFLPVLPVALNQEQAGMPISPDELHRTGAN